MKIIINNKIYVQKKDLELIIKSNTTNIPENIINKYNENEKSNDIDFIVFEDEKDINYLNGFWFIINYNDLIDFTDMELREYKSEDLTHLRKMRVECDKHKYLSEHKEYTNEIEKWLDEFSYFCLIPSIEESKKYPIDFRLLYNKISDINEIEYINAGLSKVNLPKELFKPIHYSKKQLQKIYHEVLCNELTFEELKPYEEQLYCIFTKIDYTPDISDIIKKVILINKNNNINFIQDDLLDLVLCLEGKQTKFQESTMYLIDYLYAIGHNQFDDFESKIILEKDMNIIKKIIWSMSIALYNSNIDDKSLETLKRYNEVLANIISTLKYGNFSRYISKLKIGIFISNDEFLNYSRQYIKEIFLNMLVFVYFRPEVINYNYDFLNYVYNYLTEHIEEVVEQSGYKGEKIYKFGENFIKNFNYANNLLLKLYEEKYNNAFIKKLVKEINEDVQR